MSGLRLLPLRTAAALALGLLACSLTNLTTPEPALPTAGIPAAPEPAPLRVVYTANLTESEWGDLWLVEGGTPPRQLTAAGKDDRPQFSDDGRFVAFNRNTTWPVTELWVISSDGSGERALVSSDWLSAVRPGTPMSLHRAQWVPGTHRLAFTVVVVTEEVGLELDPNLYEVDAQTGEIRVASPAGAPFTLFFYSPDASRLALTSTTAISLVDADGSGWQEPVTFKGTGLGDSAYVPSVEWAPDGTYLRAALPAADLLSPGFVLWHIPADGQPASILGTVQDGSYLAYSPDLAHLAYLAQPDVQSNVFELRIAQGDGAQAAAYAAGSIYFMGWAPDGRRFTYTLGSTAYLGEIGAPPRPLFTDASPVLDPRWIGDDQILFISGADTSWHLFLGTPGGESDLLVPVESSITQFDFSR